LKDGEENMQPMYMERTIPGWGADAPMERRPGVPRETDPPSPIGAGSLAPPQQQTNRTPTAKAPWKPLTPVYGTAVPLRGLSGVVRRAAYAMPDYKPRRWMLLMLADRIDVIEHNVAPAMTLLAIGLLGALGVRALVRR
jgi:hypothetical protein